MLEGLVAAKHIQRLGSTLVMELPATGLPVHEADGNSTVAGEAATNLYNCVQTAQELGHASGTGSKTSSLTTD